MSDIQPTQQTYRAINFADKLALFSDQWQARVVAEMNDYQFKVVRIEGDFVWHQHATRTKHSSCWTASCASTCATAL